MKTMKSRCVKIIGIILITLIGIGVNAATIDVPADYATIQAAINAASTSDVINVAAGTYYETLNIITADITIIGASRTSVIIDPTGLASNNSGIYVAANNVTLQSFTLQSTITSSLPRYGVKFGQVDGCTLEDVTVSDAYRSGIDALGTSHLTVSNVSSLDNGGHGLSLVDCNYVSVIDITLSGNAWQNASVATWGRYTPLGTSNIFFTGTNSFGDLFQLEMGDYNNPGVAPAGNAIITYSTNPIDGADVTFQASDFAYALHGTQNDGPDQERIWFFSSLANAATVPPLAPIGHWSGDGMYIESLSDGSQFYATPGCSIQAAIDAASAGDVINVSAGTYTEALLINKPLTLLGATAGVNKNGYTVPSGYAWDDAVETIIMHPNPSGGYVTIVDIYDTDDVTFDGFIVQELSASGNLNTSLMRVYAHSKVISNIEVVNSIIGPNTNTASQDGTHGRMGLYIINHPYGTNGVTNSTFAGNKIFDCKGNGNNIFLWTSYYAYGAAGPASMAGTVIEDNEIYGSHRSGIETAGGFSDLVIRNNEIYDNSELPGDAAGKLKYGNGILLIRGSSDKVSDPLTAFGPVNLTIEGNNIYGNSKNGIYMGPKNDDVTITNNAMYNNGWDGVIVDLNGTYWNAQFETEPTVLQYACYDCSNNVIVIANTIYGNGTAGNVDAEFGAHVNGTSTNGFVLDASGNWWGDLDPSDDVMGDVDYNPFWMANYMGDAHTSPWDWGVDNTGTIIDGIATASAGDNVNVFPGTYAETFTVDKSVSVIGAGIAQTFTSGGIILSAGVSDVVLQHLYITGAGASSSIIRAHGDNTNFTFDNCVVDGEGISGRYGYSGGSLVGDVDFTNNEFKNVANWSLLDSRSGSGGDGSAMGTITFANNNIHECDGTIAFRGLSTNRTAVANVYGNTFTNIGDNFSAPSQHWAAFEINRTINLNLYDNTFNTVALGEWGEGQGLQIWDIDNLDVHDNQFVDCYQGIWVYGGGTFTVPGGSIYHNSFTGSTDYSVGVDPTAIGSGILDAEENYWGALLCPDITPQISGSVDYDPWCNDDFSNCGLGCLLTEAWVDDDWAGTTNGDPISGHIFGYDAFATIQEAIDAVNGSTVHVAAGTYREQLYIDKDLDLLGSGSVDCIIEAPDAGSRSAYSITQWTGSVKTIDAVIGVNTAGTVNIDGFKIDGRDTGPANFYGVCFFDTDCSISNCIIDNITYSANPSTSSIVSLLAVHSLGAAFTIDITGNTVPTFQKGGLVLMGPGCEFSVNDNIVTGQASGSLAGNCIQLSYGAHGSTSGNYVEGTAYTGEDWSATGILLFESGDVSMDGDEVYNCQSGIDFSDWGWIHLQPTAVNLNFTNLNLHGNEWPLGVQLSRDNSDVNFTLTNSVILDNGGDGLDLYGTDEDIWGGSYYTGWENGDLTAVITGCTITNSFYDGIWAADLSGNASNTSDIDVHGCYFSGNTSSAVNNSMPETVDATGCYWDDPTGATVGSRSRSSRSVRSLTSPYGDDLPKKAATITTSYNDTRGSGETVLGPISYSPFWMANYIGDAHTSPWSWGVDNTGTIGDGYATASSGDNITVYAGSYTEQVTLTPGKDITLVGEDRDLVTWIAPAGSKCLTGNMTGYTGDMNYEVSGFTFNCRALATATYGAGVYIYRATNGPLMLSIHDNKFIEDRASGDDSHWATSIFACHNRFAERDGFGDAPVLIFDNIDETWGGMTMSNTRAFDIYGNTFDGCSDAIYNGHGCPDSDPTLFFGDHHIYDNIFMNASDDLHSSTTPALDWQYYGAGAGTHMPSIIEDNTFEDNDVAMRFVFDTDMTYPAHDVTGNSFINNGMAVIVDGAFASTLDAEENYWGTLSCPVVASNVTGPVDYEPWCNSDFSFCGFACSLAEVWVDDDWVGTAEGTNVGGHIFGYDAFDVIADGVNAVSDAGTVHVFDGNYDIPINIDSRTGVSILGESEAGTIFKPATTLDWGFAPYDAGRQAAIRVFGSTGVTLSNMTMDFDLIKADNTFGLLFWNSAGEISNNTLQNMNTAGYYEFISYLRAPDYTDGARAQIDILNNTFLKTGRVGVVAHDYINLLVEGNSFDMVVDDFGYAIELGSAATGTIRDNIFSNYDTWAATDQSTVSAIYVENSFTMGIVDPISKPVVIEGNEITSCQYGIIVGNEVPGYAGNVDIVVTIEDNNIYDNSTSGSLTSGAILLTDEGKDAGSSINATVHNNMIYNNGDYGLLINTDGNGDISSTLTENIFAENYTGVSIKDYATISTSSYSMIVHHNFFDNFLNAEDDVAGGYWDDLTTNEGNCWSDWETNVGYPLHYTISGNADARDRKPNRANCDGMGDCETGEANGEAPINILDIVYLINFKYKEGPDPIPYALCSGDPNCDCEINILDIVYLINFKYKEGPAPCGGSDWMFACKLPIRGETPAKSVVSLDPINEEISANEVVSKDQINEKTLEIPLVSDELINDTKKVNSFSAFK